MSLHRKYPEWMEEDYKWPQDYKPYRKPDKTFNWGENEYCVWDSLTPEERAKPQMISCPCRKCNPYSM